MIIYLDYLDKDKFKFSNKNYVQVDESIFESKDEAIDYLITKILEIDKSLVCCYEIDGKYQLLPKNPIGESKYFRINRNISQYQLNININVVKDRFNNREILKSSYVLNDNDSNKICNGVINSVSLSDMIDLVRVELYKIGICKYNSNISVNTSIESTEESDTFSVRADKSSSPGSENVYRYGIFVFKKGNEPEKSEVIDMFKSELESILYSSIHSAFGDYNPEINLDNLSVSINYGDE